MAGPRPLRPGATSIAFLVLATAFAGCLGGDDADSDATSMSTPSATGPNPFPTVSTPAPVSTTNAPLVEVSEEDIFAAVWNAGQSWTYEVSGAFFPVAYTATVGVVSVAGDRYEIGTDSEDELKNAVHHDNGLFLGGVQKDSLAINHGDDYLDLFGFFKPIGATWGASIFGVGFTLTKNTTATVTHGAGSALGLRVTGVAPVNTTLVIEYATDVGALTRFHWESAGVVMLDYSLTSWAPAGTPGLRQWAVTDFRTGDASGPPNNLGVDQWASDGTGDLVFVRIVLTPTPLGRAWFIDPAGAVAITGEAATAAVVTVDGLLTDAQGTWVMLMATDSGALATQPNTDPDVDPANPGVPNLVNTGPAARVDVYVYQIVEAAA